MTAFGIFFATAMLLATGLGGVIGVVAMMNGWADVAFFCGCLFATPWAFIVGAMNGKALARKC